MASSCFGCSAAGAPSRDPATDGVLDHAYVVVRLRATDTPAQLVQEFNRRTARRVRRQIPGPAKSTTMFIEDRRDAMSA
jgi:hypothetical protein